MEKVISKDGTSIAFDRAGNGQPIILVDGAFCSRSFGPMPKLAQLLAKHFTVIKYDRRGRGDSGDTKPYAVEREIEDLEALIKEAGGSAFAFGMSSGGALCIAAAAYGLPIKKLSLYEPPYLDFNDHRPLAGQVAYLTELIKSGRRDDAVKFYMKGMGVPSSIVAVMRLLPLWTKLKAMANSLPYDNAVMSDFLLPVKQTASFSVPTLVTGGDKSPLWMRKAVQAVADAIPDAHHRLLKGQNHNVSVKALAPVLEEFFNA